MAANITFKASEIWDYFQRCMEDLKKNMHRIADNKEYGIEIFVTEDSGLPNIVVMADDVLVYDETTVSAKDCVETINKVYDEYLTEKVVSVLSAKDGDRSEGSDIDALIEVREEELDNAVYNFIKVALDGYVDEESANFAKICEDLKEHFLEYMARKHDLPVYRPMYLEYEDGVEELEEFPYENLEFEDEDNPIYK